MYEMNPPSYLSRMTRVNHSLTAYCTLALNFSLLCDAKINPGKIYIASTNPHHCEQSTP